MNKEKCPCCPNHCSEDNLACGRGINYFNNKSNSSGPMSINEQIIMDLRKCGHFLHHNRDFDIDKILYNFSEDELNQLHELLSKIHNNFE